MHVRTKMRKWVIAKLIGNLAVVNVDNSYQNVHEKSKNIEGNLRYVWFARFATISNPSVIYLLERRVLIGVDKYRSSQVSMGVEHLKML